MEEEEVEFKSLRMGRNAVKGCGLDMDDMTTVFMTAHTGCGYLHKCYSRSSQLQTCIDGGGELWDPPLMEELLVAESGQNHSLGFGHS